MKKMISRVLTTSYFALCFLMLFSKTAHAYIDPSTTTYIVQAVAGIAVAVGAFFMMYWRKLKRKMAEKMNIDADKNKETEEEVRFTDSDKK